MKLIDRVVKDEKNKAFLIIIGLSFLLFPSFFFLFFFIYFAFINLFFIGMVLGFLAVIFVAIKLIFKNIERIKFYKNLEKDYNGRIRKSTANRSKN